MTHRIFVFGSNLEGRHGAGAAAYAHKHHGAVMGEGIGLFGNSYAIPTMPPMRLQDIKSHVEVFVAYANYHPQLAFDLTHIGCGIAGYNWARDIRPLFPRKLPSNITILEPI